MRPAPGGANIEPALTSDNYSHFRGMNNEGYYIDLIIKRLLTVNVYISIKINIFNLRKKKIYKITVFSAIANIGHTTLTLVSCFSAPCGKI